jgi:LAO/AO transport system kinase
MYETIDQHLRDHFYHNEKIAAKLAQLEQQVTDEEIGSFTAAHQLLDMYYSQDKPSTVI